MNAKASVVSDMTIASTQYRAAAKAIEAIFESHSAQYMPREDMIKLDKMLGLLSAHSAQLNDRIRYMIEEE